MCNPDQGPDTVSIHAPARGAARSPVIIWSTPGRFNPRPRAGGGLYWDATSDSVDKTNTNIPCGLAYTHEIADTPTIQVILNK